MKTPLACKMKNKKNLIFNVRSGKKGTLIEKMLLERLKKSVFNATGLRPTS